jgi:NADH-quinone oxidoreductase subunit H
MVPLAFVGWPNLPGPPWLQEVVIKFAAAALLILPFVSVWAMFSIWAERKVAGRMQSRHGPMRVGGWHGWLQSLADGIKLIGKEDLIPAEADHVLFRLAPYLAFAPAFAAFFCLAWSRDLSGLTSTLNVGVFFLLAILGIEVLGVILAGWGSNNKWSVYGAMREACQMVSYEIPLGLAIICAVMVAGTLNLYDVSIMQARGLTSWLAFHDPFNFLAFILYFVAALASCKRAPFDLPESESELVAGYHTEYSGIRWSLFFFAEYAAMFVVAAIQTSLWLGAWYDPFGLVNYLEAHRFAADGSIAWNYMALANGLGAGIFITKAVLLVLVQIWLRWTLPRMRIDQVLFMCVKVLLPVACLNLVAAAIYLWLVDPALPGGARNGDLVLFSQIVQITLAAIGVLVLAGIASLVAWAYVTRSKATFKVLYPNRGELRTLPGA